MAKYIKQEVPDMQKTGEQKVFYRLKLERAGIVRVNQVLKVSQDMALTGLSHTTAANELRAFSRDASSGIGKVERRPAVVYVKKGNVDE